MLFNAINTRMQSRCFRIVNIKLSQKSINLIDNRSKLVINFFIQLTNILPHELKFKIHVLPKAFYIFFQNFYLTFQRFKMVSQKLIKVFLRKMFHKKNHCP